MAGVALFIQHGAEQNRGANRKTGATKRNQAAAEALSASGTSAIVFRTCEAIW